VYLFACLLDIYLSCLVSPPYLCISFDSRRDHRNYIDMTSNNDDDDKAIEYALLSADNYTDRM